MALNVLPAILIDGLVVTLILYLTLILLSVTVIVAVPFVLQVIRPLELTVATDFLPEEYLGLILLRFDSLMLTTLPAL